MDKEKLQNELYMNEYLSDVTICASDGEKKWRFPAHSFILKSRSPVFKVMLEDDFVEKSSNEIVITDFSWITIKDFLKFLYRDVLPDSINDIRLLLKMADKYNVPSLIRKCENILLLNVNLKNVFTLYNDSCLYSCEKLQTNCLSLMKRAAFKFVDSSDFESFPKDLVMEFVSADSINVLKEVDIFWAVWQWSKIEVCSKTTPSNDCIIQEVSQFLPHIRWNLINSKEKEKLSKTGIIIPTGDAENHPLRTPSTMPSLVDNCDVIDFTKLATRSENGTTCVLKFQYSICRFCWISQETAPIYITGILIEISSVKGVSEGSVFLINKTTREYQNEAVRNMKEGNSCQKFRIEFKYPLKVYANNEVQVIIFTTDGQPPGQCFMPKFEFENTTIFSKKGKSFLTVGNVLYGVRKLFLL